MSTFEYELARLIGFAKRATEMSDKAVQVPSTALEGIYNAAVRDREAAAKDWHDNHSAFLAKWDPSRNVAAVSDKCETCNGTKLVPDPENGSGGLDCPTCTRCNCARTPMLDLSRGTDAHDDDCPWHRDNVRSPAIIPSKLHGYPVVAALPRDPQLGSFVVLVHRTDYDFEPYVTGIWFRRKVEPADVASTRAAINASADGWAWGNYCATLEEGLTSLVQRATQWSHWEKIIKPQLPSDAGSAPPTGFERYRVEIDVPIEIDSSDLLERAQEWCTEMIEAVESEGNDDKDEPLDDTARELITERVSVQKMQG